MYILSINFYSVSRSKSESTNSNSLILSKVTQFTSVCSLRIHETLSISLILTSPTYEGVDLGIKEIIDFADIGEHLNQPVKTYSSGRNVYCFTNVNVDSVPSAFFTLKGL